MANDILFNTAHDMDKDEVVAAYLTKAEKDALYRYSKETGISMSDLAGGWIWRGLKAAYQLPENYSRPTGM